MCVLLGDRILRSGDYLNNEDIYKFGKNFTNSDGWVI